MTRNLSSLPAGSRRQCAGSRPVLALLLGIAAIGCAHAGTASAQVGEMQAVGDALQRPALMVRAPDRVVLQAAAQAGKRLVIVGERGVVALSEDGARTWHQVPTPVSVTLTMVRFADDRHGVAVGHGGSVLTTQDSGATWTLRVDGRQLAQLALASAKASGDPARLRDAERLVTDGPDKPLLDVLMLDAQRLLVVGAYGLVFYSADGGANWQCWMDRLDNPRAQHLYALRRAGESLLIAGEQGLVLKSDDDGRTFRRLATPYMGSFFTAEMNSAQELVVAGLRGNVWRSVDGGIHWTQLATPSPASVTASARRPDGTLVLVTQAGTMLSGRDALAPIAFKQLPPLNGVLVRDDGSLLTLGVQGAVLVPPVNTDGTRK